MTHLWLYIVCKFFDQNFVSISPLLVIVGIELEMKVEFLQLFHALPKCVISSKMMKSILQ